jgi:hypothetical protein
MVTTHFIVIMLTTDFVVVDSHWVYSEQCRSQNYKVRMHRTVRCATGLSGVARGERTSKVNRSKPQRSADVARTGLSDVPINNNDWNSGWGYKYPQSPPFEPSKFLDLHIQYKSKSIHSKTQSKDQILFKPQNQLKCLETWDMVFCAFFVALVAWIAFSFSL